ncbi:sigma factor-like helix-turn-helix DNA-binding protein [Sphingobium sp. CR2-8]|uniref:sigma factor-like helix-turn-helix DNA-binding protein n=1 Tax=Sphingobium sp. CR2-8 TaxID=1306534 RepID=UPI002DBFF626|nr:sigma factor-like helix-turn-helix DNA-binding protein [Sphingobium sp. CR2-8]MEC3910307.1 sigma factor-like helix-turn-helix DNA-binding protein [Sphingobium sp. CR2-8]
MTDITDTERLERLEAALLSMPRLRREIFLAARLDAMTYGDIAHRTGLSVRAVERQMARAIVHIGRHLRDADAPSPDGSSPT